MADIESERERSLKEIAAALHDMCQPLTALYCRLEIGQLSETTANASTAVWTDCLRECGRLTEAVSTMRNLVQHLRTSERGRENT